MRRSSKPRLRDTAVADQHVHVAAVYAADGIRFLTAALSADELWSNLTSYVQRNVGKLWQGDEARVRGLIEAGRHRDAITEYLNAIGDRWDPEQLHVEAVTVCW